MLLKNNVIYSFKKLMVIKIFTTEAPALFKNGIACPRKFSNRRNDRKQRKKYFCYFFVYEKSIGKSINKVSKKRKIVQVILSNKFTYS